MQIIKNKQAGQSTGTQAGQSLFGLQGEAFYLQWLTRQCEQIAGIHAGLLAIKSPEHGIFQPVAIWPGVMPEIEIVSKLIEQVIEDQSPLVTHLNDSDDEPLLAIAHPVMVKTALMGVAVLILDGRSDSVIQAAMRQLQWGISWVELSLLRETLNTKQDEQQRLSTAVDLLTKVLAEPHFDAAAMRLVSELAVVMQCDLVSLGFVRDGSVTVCHLSHSAQFTKRMNLVRSIESAMDEAVDQGRMIALPVESTEGLIIIAHQALAKQHQGESILTVPLYHDGQCVGAITFQRAEDKPFSSHEAQYCESATALAGTALEEKRLNDRPLWRKALESGKTQLHRLLGPGYLGRKLTAIVSLSCILFLTFATGENRLSAEAALATVMQRVVVAPYDGYVRDATVRAGDEVKEGELLVALDDRDLQLEKLRWSSHQNKLSRQYQEATADYNRARVNIIAAQLDQARAQLNLVESQIERSRQEAPFNGLVISGDLSQRLGGPVSKGEVLFEVSPLDAYRVDLKVPESRIADIALGQTGMLHLSALPGEPYEFVVDKITPKTLSEDGATWFIVEARLQDEAAQLRPGMEGIGKVELGEDKLVTIWTRDLLAWLRLKLWMWWA
ncbi:MAG: hypothetical protein B0D91_03715 [Oceanospirillales bacterium LUC14_002_19_P2]|nr:MAG: hypothetical protein B0D91_03715 [Oceanospirillales bacterium LUC14_002_19_P2]